MFSDRFDSLMNIAEVSNSRLGRDINMDPSYIGRLRSGARPLPKKHDYLSEMCCYLARNIKKEYQLNALQKLTGIDSSILISTESTALNLEQWLLEQEQDTLAAAKRLISGFSNLASSSISVSENIISENISQKYVPYFYGNEGKRRAVEQFFIKILQEKKTQTLLLFSDENMAWLYEDAEFAARWAELFTKAILKGNRVKIIHTISRDMNEMLEAIAKWLPIYMSGIVEPYYYPRLRDGIFRRTLFIAPNTAAIASSSIQQDTDGMINLFITDRAAIDGLTKEYERYFALCRPLMRIFTTKDANLYRKAAVNLAEIEGNACLCCVMPPLFTMPDKLVHEFSLKTGNEALSIRWKNSLSVFQKNIKNQRLTLVLKKPEIVLFNRDILRPSIDTLFAADDFTYTKEKYEIHIKQLEKLEKQYENLKIYFVDDIADNILLYVKENSGIVMAKPNMPQMAFVINEKNMVGAFWDYLEKCVMI